MKRFPAFLFAFVAACSSLSEPQAPEVPELPGESSNVMPGSPPEGADQTAPWPGTIGEGGGATGSGASPGGESSPAPDGGAPTAPVDVFAGTPAYTSTVGPSSRSDRHGEDTSNPAGQACLSCHDGARKKGEPLLFGGTVYKDMGGTTPASGVEVRVRDAAGLAMSAYTDADGNFFFVKPGKTALQAPLRAGIRNATSVRAMTNVISEGDCNSCHREGGQGRLVLP